MSKNFEKLQKNKKKSKKNFKKILKKIKTKGNKGQYLTRTRSRDQTY